MTNQGNSVGDNSGRLVQAHTITGDVVMGDTVNGDKIVHHHGASGRRDRPAAGGRPVKVELAGPVMAVAADEPVPLRAALHAAVAATRLPLTVHDLEYGALVRAGSGGAPVSLVSQLIPALRSRLGDLRRVRIAVDPGGSPLRLLAAPSLDRIFSARRSAQLAVLVSEAYYRAVIVEEHRSVDVSVFGRVRADDPDGIAWAWVPGSSAPPASVIVPPSQSGSKL